jgi:hypothetical protein
VNRIPDFIEKRSKVNDNEKPDIAANLVALAGKIDSRIEEFGHTCIWVGPNHKAPAFTYTVGMTECSWPELICMSLGPQSGIEIVDCVVSKLRSTDTKPFHGMIVTEALNVPIHLIEMSEWLPPLYFVESQARNQRIGRPELPIRGFQAVWPDTEGKFPWEPGYDHYGFPQDLLGVVPKNSGGLLN